MSQSITPLSERVAAEVRAELGRKMLPAAALGPVLQIDTQSAQRRVRGAQPFPLDELPVLAEFFQIPLSQLLTGQKNGSAAA